VSICEPPEQLSSERGIRRLILKEKTMKYMLLIYSDENAWTEREREQCFAESTALTHELHKQGKFLGASPLRPVSTATSVRVREGVRHVTDGPATSRSAGASVKSDSRVSVRTEYDEFADGDIQSLMLSSA
jgi:radical SAM superfamily enzyme with C-terminal helix-hairpin-helix motif